MSIMMYRGDHHIPNSLELFLSHSKKLIEPKVLELGTKRSINSRSTIHNDWISHASVFHGSDIEGGDDVDIIADVHKLSTHIEPESYDVIISCSTFEHFKYPHLAAHEMLKCLKIGGLIFIQTHFTFPLHAYPYDYCRFSTEALDGLFEGQGVNIIKSDYTYPCTINSDADGIHDSYLNSNIFLQKINTTEDNFKYILDTNL